MYNFDHVKVTDHFEVKVDSAEQHGYFEHKELGDQCGGELLFINNDLIDYDGVFELPMEVIVALREMGFTVEEDFE